VFRSGRRRKAVFPTGYPQKREKRWITLLQSEKNTLYSKKNCFGTENCENSVILDKTYAQSRIIWYNPSSYSEQVFERMRSGREKRPVK